jgi:aryl-alcohol dehydrogenase-like predicted oxidoreductase
MAELTRVASEVQLSNGALVIAWMMQQVSPTVIPLVGPRTLAQLEALLPAATTSLTAEQLRRLDEAGLPPPKPACEALEPLAP